MWNMLAPRLPSTGDFLPAMNFNAPLRRKDRRKGRSFEDLPSATRDIAGRRHLDGQRFLAADRKDVDESEQVSPDVGARNPALNDLDGEPLRFE
jgi:hypothetical protein